MSISLQPATISSSLVSSRTGVGKPAGPNPVYFGNSHNTPAEIPEDRQAKQHQITNVQALGFLITLLGGVGLFLAPLVADILYDGNLDLLNTELEEYLAMKKAATYPGLAAFTGMLMIMLGRRRGNQGPPSQSSETQPDTEQDKA